MTSLHHPDRRTIMTCLALSLLAHLMLAAPLDYFKQFQLGNPVLQIQPVIVDLQDAAATPPAEEVAPPSPVAPAHPDNSAPQSAEQERVVPAEEPGPVKVAAAAAPTPAPQVTTPPPVAVAAPAGSVAGAVAADTGKVAPDQKKGVPTEGLLAPLRKPSEFLASDWEKLSYRISMLGIPVGTAELEAKREKGEVRITLRIQSNAAISQWYPVDDSVETRHIGGNFILSRIRQREGSFRGDRGFTIFLRDQSVFWIDRVKNLSFREPLPNNSVLDILSGLYYLRNQPLEVGKPVQLELFDSNRYAPTTVDVLRKEQLTLPGLREVATLLVHPQLKTEGIFRRTGEILVWITDDQKKVPVRVETRVPLGNVTAELVSAESQQHGAAPAGDATQRKAGQPAKP